MSSRPFVSESGDRPSSRDKRTAKIFIVNAVPDLWYGDASYLRTGSQGVRALCSYSEALMYRKPLYSTLGGKNKYIHIFPALGLFEL